MRLHLFRAVVCSVMSTWAYNPPMRSQRVETVHTDSPRLYRVSGFLTDFEMDYIINASFQNLRSSKTYGPETGMHYELPIYGDAVLEHIENRLLSITPGVGKRKVSVARSASESRGEVLFVRRYLQDGLSMSCSGGDRFHKHQDFTDDGDGAKILVSMTMYLTSPEKGGQTRFEAANGGQGYDFQARRGAHIRVFIKHMHMRLQPHVALHTHTLSMTHCPIGGDLGIWWSCKHSGERDMNSTHGGVPLKAGIKWIATRFLYDSVSKCDVGTSDTVLVPTAVKDNKENVNSMSTLHGMTMPHGVVHMPDCSADALSATDQSFDGVNEKFISIIARNAELEAKMNAKLDNSGDTGPDEDDWYNMDMI